MEAEKEQSEFTLVNFYSWGNFYLSIGMLVTLLGFFSVIIFIESDVKYVFAILLGGISFIIFLLKLRELRKTTNIIVNHQKIIYGAEELMPDEIDEIIFFNWIVDIKRKKGTKSHIRVTLKNNDELETLKSRMIEYGNYNNIRIRREW